ncbi:CAP domain-containing protein [Chondromyces crocatus]|uniref:SCP domain-containing protein n=1 Tax=Chondromyces crocatus TaxID=52 RepID=A0A0K1ETP0_CHOCO|nr:CAP domain-containing protein [Chondromyces crocatus]AKT43998.1 uncharacterized protein CMC5_082360 [Chondromyces crocatus]
MSQRAPRPDEAGGAQPLGEPWSSRAALNIALNATLNATLNAALSAVLLAGCTASPLPAPSDTPRPAFPTTQTAPRPSASATASPTPSPGLTGPQPPPLPWAQATESPQPLAATPETATLLSLCGTADAALTDVARRNVERQVRGLDIFPSDELLFTFRAAGGPHPWPRAWSIDGDSLTDGELSARFGAWVDGWRTFGQRRCGVARGTRANGSEVVSVVGVDALADLAALPTTARLGQWLTVEGFFLVPVHEARLVLLGPRGAPRSVPATLYQNRVRSSFSVDQVGTWLVQVLATVSTGPRPVLEAMVHVDASPPVQFQRVAAPGEDAARGASDDADAMMRMINAARAAEGQPPLARDAALDALALQHAQAMSAARLVGHDVGHGDPAARLAAANYAARIAGENVATSDTPEHAHRAIWASPSHRGNLLMGDYTRAGVGVVRDAHGRVWVAELFAGG